MAQSNDSNVRGIPPFWPNHTLEPPHAWTQWSDQFQLAIIAKENLDIESLHGPEIPETQIPILEQATGSESDAEKANRESRNKSTMKQYESAEEKRINEEKRKFNGMRRTEADKKLRSILFLALGSEGKRVFTQKNPRVKILAISFSEFWTLLDAAFNKPPNTTFERYKLLNRKQKDRESYEQFWGALTDLASTCNIKESDEAEWIRDIFICNMKNTDTQRKLLSATISPSEALNQALIDEKGYFNHQKLTNMSRSSTNGTTFKSFSNHNHIKKEPSLNIERSNSCMKCGNTFTKGHLNVCPAKDITCKNCNYKGHFAKLCKSRNKRPTVNNVSNNFVNTENCTYTPPENSWMEEKESCDVINAWNEYGQSDDDDFSVLSVRTIYDNNGLETKKLLNLGIGWDMIVNMNIPVDSASPVSFLKQNVLHEIKLRYPNLKIHPVEKRIKDLLYCGFTNDTINILGKIIVRTQSNGWISEETPFFITGGHERNILGNDNLPKLGIEISQRKCPQPICMISQPTLESEYKNLPSLSDNIFNEFKDLFTRVGKIPNDRKVTHFHTPFKPIQSKGRRVQFHLLAAVNDELKRMEKEGHIIKLEKCDEDCFISPIVITRKKDSSIKLALDSKLLNDQIFKNKYQMPNIHELIDNVALQISEKPNGRVWFSNLDLKNAYSQLQLCNQTSKQCNFSIVGGETTGTYRFLTGFYGLGDMPNDFQRVMDSMLKNIPFTNCYIDDILVASRGSLEEHKAIVHKILSILDKNNMAVKWGKCAFFKSDIEWLGFKISGNGVRPLVGKADAIKNLPTPKNISELRSFFGSINQYVKFVPNLSTLSSPLRPLLNKKSLYKWDTSHSIAFEK